jgi:hypothetical protein
VGKKSEFTSKMPVGFHNFENYDCSFIIQGLEKDLCSKVDILATSIEKIPSLIIKSNIQFLDS